MVIAIISILIGLLLPAVQKIREAANRMKCTNNLKQIGLALHNYHDTMSVFPPGYTDGNTDPASTPDNDIGPGWGWASYLLPYIEQDNLYRQIDFNQGVGIGDNIAVSQTALTIFQCPSDGQQRAFPVYDSSFSSPIATVAHGNYVGCNGWQECYYNAGGSLGDSNSGPFYRNSRTNMASITDGLSNTIVVGERSSNHSPSTWTGAVTGGRCPAWMATEPPTPFSAPPGLAYDYSDFDEAFVLAHGNSTHVPNADFPAFDPDTFYSRHIDGANFLFGDGSVHFLSSRIDGNTFQSMCTIAGGEQLGNW